VILEAVFGGARQFTAEEILRTISQLGEQVSLMTIYRTLQLIEKTGFLVAFEAKDGTRIFSRQDAASASVGQLRCLDCGLIVPIQDPCFEWRSAPELMSWVLI